ncbi:MAG: anthranilate synthase component I [Parvibaculales bacterium]
MPSPDFSTFSDIYESGNAQIIWKRLKGKRESVLSDFVNLAGSAKNSFLLESAEDGETRGRYSLIGLLPDIIFRIQNGEPERSEDGKNFSKTSGKALEAFRSFLSESRIDIPDELPPMAAGIFGYMSYDMVREMEHLPDQPSGGLGLPDSLFLRPSIIAIFDNHTNHITIVTPIRKTSLSAKEAYEKAQAQIGEMEKRLAQKQEAENEIKGKTLAPPQSNISRKEYSQMVERAKEYIRAGDIFQVVLSQRFSCPYPLSGFSLYRSLRKVNPSPYLFFLNFEGFSVIGSSPEALVKLEKDNVTIRPIAGTRAREDKKNDALIGKELLADPKERAEHLMLLDLGRNDVGRVSEIGSVKVSEQFNLQITSHLIHIVSNVTGKLRKEYDGLEALCAGFPAGTVSGAPKIRAMEIIDELEAEKRGIYAGCVGYFSANGDIDSCIALRTAILKDGQLYVQAGGGIVADSTSEYEYEETVNKSKALFHAAQKSLEEDNQC